MPKILSNTGEPIHIRIEIKVISPNSTNHSSLNLKNGLNMNNETMRLCISRDKIINKIILCGILLVVLCLLLISRHDTLVLIVFCPISIMVFSALILCCLEMKDRSVKIEVSNGKLLFDRDRLPPSFLRQQIIQTRIKDRSSSDVSATVSLIGLSEKQMNGAGGSERCKQTRVLEILLKDIDNVNLDILHSSTDGHHEWIHITTCENQQITLDVEDLDVDAKDIYIMLAKFLKSPS